ncbi:MAG: hypothetical protein IT365_29445 [Candidatus Hydrogenedentes bacterium]|nr:hypothetical protein [Candidatus Hydrogenedentota bacterium]
MRKELYYLPVAPQYSPGQPIRTTTAATSDPLTAFTQGKVRILGQTIDQIVTDIEERQDLGERLTHEIDLRMTDLKEPLYQVAPFGSSPVTVGDPRRRAAIEKALLSLETERRREEVGTWKDISGLKRELRDVVREYEEEKNRARVMSG